MAKHIAIMVLVVLLTAGIVAADYAMIHDVTRGLLYFVPIALCAWFFNRWTTLGLCVVVAGLRSLYAPNPCPHYIAGSYVTYPHWCYDYLAGTLIRMVFFGLWGLVIGFVRQQREYIENLGMDSVTDSLTGLYNSTFIRMRLEEEKARAEWYKRSFTLLMIDIDHLKAFNKANGRHKGNDLLVKVADVLRKGVREIGVVCRRGGEEFLTILPETDKEEGALVAERLRAAVADALLAKSPPVTVSIGVATYPTDANSPQQTILAADNALRRAKDSGRNCVCKAQPATGPQ
jgi:diguanylate cyclase (GGDEF)-like protein